MLTLTAHTSPIANIATSHIRVPVTTAVPGTRFTQFISVLLKALGAFHA